MSRLLLALPACALAACISFETAARPTLDPIVVVHGPGGDELGVSTDYGVAFLGRTIQSGRVEFTAWFGDGPTREEGLVEAMGGGVFATDSEILLPSVPVIFEALPEGTSVIVRGRHAGVPYEIETEILDHAAVTGVLLRPTKELDALTDDDLGAGVFYVQTGKPLQLVGLLSGRLQIDDRRYITVLGGEDLWRLVVHRRNSDRPRRWVYRDDIM